MNNMYDIIKKMNLLEGKGSKPDFLDLDKDGNKAEPMKSAAKEVDEASYSAKSARAGKDIGKPGKAFAQIAAKAGKAYGSKERGEKVAGAVLRNLRAKEDVEQEGNAFTAKLKATPKGGKFKLGDKTFKDTSDLEEAQLDELDMNLIKSMQKHAASKPRQSDPESDRNIHKKYGYRSDRDDTGNDDDYDEWGNEKKGAKKSSTSDGPKKKGRPKGSGKKLGAKGPTGRSKLLKKGSIKEGDDQFDHGEYDREGDMAKEQLHTIERAAKELHSILSDEQNLPEWVQSKITKAMDYIDTARDYMLSQGEEQAEEMPVAEKAVSKAQQKFMGMVHAAQKGGKPASKEVAKVAKSMGKKDAEDFAATKHKGLPEKVKKEQEVEETTTAGSVAVAPAQGKGKKGMIFGKGVYESQVAESFEKKLGQVLNEGMSINMSVDENGQKTLNVNATDADAEQLAQILKMAGLGGGQPSQGCGCDTSPCSCEQMDEGQDDLANAPDVEMADTDTLVNTLAGGLNKPKRDVAGNGQTTVPVTATRVHEDANIEAQLLNLYKQYKA